MIRSLRSWHAEAVTPWEAAQKRYRRHLREIGPTLPTRLRQFVRQFTLHDYRFDRLHVISSLPSGKDALVTIRLYRDGVVGTAALLELHFVRIRGVTSKLPLDRDILFFDVEASATGSFKMSFAVDTRKIWSIRFSDFNFYVYEYDQKPNKAPEPTPVPVMPRASLRVIEVEQGSAQRNSARVTPGTGVAHL